MSEKHAKENEEALTSPYPPEGRDAPRTQKPRPAAAPRGLAGWLLVGLGVAVLVFVLVALLL